MNEEKIQNQLIYSTVRIKSYSNDGFATGTGFFVMKEYDNNVIRIVLVTNKHVVEGYSHADLMVCEADNNNDPIDSKHVTIKIPDLQSMCIMHPDSGVDLCFLMIEDLNNYLKSIGTRAYFKCIGLDFFITDDEIQNSTAIENVIMIGYPLGLMDGTNNKPVVRKGITASNIALDYNGKKEFMIDIACFPGSSGSPVFLEKTGLLQTPKEGGKGFYLKVNYWYKLLGVVYAVPKTTMKGDIVIEEVPTKAKFFTETQGFVNLGYVIKADRIKELFNLIEETERNSGK